MGCTAITPNMTAADQARHLIERMPPGLFGGVGIEESRVAWRLSPEPFWLSPETFAAIERLGPDLLKFYRMLASLYQRSVRGTAPAFIAEELDRGKPELIVRVGRQNRFKSDVPGVIRPDLILTERGFIAAELDSVPGGMGFVGAMSEAYCELGFETAGQTYGMPDGVAAMLSALTGVARPVVAFVVSEESKAYRPEIAWIADAITRRGSADAYACRPEDIVFTEEALFLRLADGREEKLDAVYRNFELFDLPNVPKAELMLYAARHNRVRITPPAKAHLEEKLSFALLHNPALRSTWKRELGDAFERLDALFPDTWVLDPRPLPPQASICSLVARGEPVRDWTQLYALGKSERDYVVKPSGFSELAWGSRGVRVGNDLTHEEWRTAIETGLASFERTPYVLQRFHKGKRVKVPYYDTKSGEIAVLDGRVRLCPYFFSLGAEEVRLGGILATVAPADKRLIHGMSEAVMSPCAVRDGGY